MAETARTQKGGSPAAPKGSTPKATVLGKQAKADLPKAVFSEPFHESLVHEAARADLNARRRGTHSTPDPGRGRDDHRQGLAPEGHRPRARRRARRPAPLRRRRRLRPEAAPLHLQGQPQGAPQGAARRAHRPRRARHGRRDRRRRLQASPPPRRPPQRSRSGARRRRCWWSSPPRRRPPPRAFATSPSVTVALANAAGVADVIGAASILISEASLPVLEERSKEVAR